MNPSDEPMQPYIEGDALPLEYQLEYGRSTRNLDLADVVNNPAVNGEVRILRAGLDEEVPDFLRVVEVGPVLQDLSDPLVVGGDAS